MSTQKGASGSAENDAPATGETWTEWGVRRTWGRVVSTATYTDSRGRRQRLTQEQRNYLEAAQRYHHIPFGWGGYRSTLTVRILRERGLLALSENHHAGVRWCITGLTTLGEQTLGDRA